MWVCSSSSSSSSSPPSLPTFVGNRQPLRSAKMKENVYHKCKKDMKELGVALPLIFVKQLDDAFKTLKGDKKKKPAKKKRA